jgi:hypothetical protein
VRFGKIHGYHMLLSPALNANASSLNGTNHRFQSAFASSSIAAHSEPRPQQFSLSPHSKIVPMVLSSGPGSYLSPALGAGLLARGSSGTLSAARSRTSSQLFQ